MQGPDTKNNERGARNEIVAIRKIGDIPVIAVPELRDFNSLFEFEWRAFEQGLTCFIRPALGFGWKPLKQSSVPKRRYLLIKKVSPKCWFSVLFSWPAADDLANAVSLIEEIQQNISNCAFAVTQLKGEVPYE